MSDYAFVRSVIWRFMPELRDSLIEIEEEQRDFEGGLIQEYGVGIYSLGTDIFINGALAPLLANDYTDERLAEKCSKVIETLLLDGSNEVRQMVSARIVDYLLGWRLWPKFEKFSGPTLGREVDNRKRYYHAFD